MKNGHGRQDRRGGCGRKMRRYEKAIEGKASPRHTGSRAGREQWLRIVNLRCRRTARMGGAPMTYITSIGLDVHASSVSACAFDPFTGEVTQRRFGYDPARSPSGSWASSRPRRCTRAARRASTCAARSARSASTASWAPSRRCTGRRPTGAARTTGATPSGWRGCSPRATSSRCGCPTAGGGRPRPVARARRRPRRPAARPAAACPSSCSGTGWCSTRPTPAGRGAGRLDRGVLEVGEVDRVRRGRDAAAYDHYVDAVRALRRVQEGARARVERGRRAPRVGGGGRRALLRQGHRRREAFLPRHRGGVTSRGSPRAVAYAAWLRPCPLGALERRDGVARRHHPRGNSHVRRALVEASWHVRCRLATPRGRGRATGPRRRRRGTQRRATAACRQARSPWPGRQATVRRQLRGRPASSPAGSGRSAARQGTLA